MSTVVDGKEYVPTDAEQAVLADCRQNAMFRGTTYGGGTMLLMYSVLRRGARKFTGWHTVALTLAGVTSFTVGLFSYSGRCVEQLVALEGSPMGESLRKTIEKNAASVQLPVTKMGGASSGSDSSQLDKKATSATAATGFGSQTRNNGTDWRTSSTGSSENDATDAWASEKTRTDWSSRRTSRRTETAAHSKSEDIVESEVPPELPPVEAFPTTFTSRPSIFDVEDEPVQTKLTYEEIRKKHREMGKSE